MQKPSFIILAAGFAVLSMVSIASPETVSGVVYHDGNRSSRSCHEQGIDPEDVPLPDVDVYLLDGASEQHAVTNEYGSFFFEDVEPGVYLLDVGIGSDYDSTSNNHPIRIPQAVRDGAVHVVTIGDSIGAMGSDVLYPERLALRFSEMVDATFTNLAIGGTTSWHWLPGAETGYFDELLAPELSHADVVTMTLGANDLGAYVEGGPPYDPIAIIQAFLEHPEYIFDILPNISVIIDAIREINPDCDVVFVVYPNIANSTAMEELLGETLQQLASFAMGIGMTIARWAIGDIEGVVLADMFGALGDTWLDPYLIDDVHPNDAGHQLYADVIFASLGGVVIEEEKGFGESQMFGFWAPDLVPTDDDDGTDDDADDDTDDDIDDDTQADDDDGEVGCGCSIL